MEERKLDDIRQILMNPIYAESMQICNQSILELCRINDIEIRIAIRALTIAQHFISTESMEQGPNFGLYWTCVGVVCFTLSVKYSETWDPLLKNTLQVVGIADTVHTRTLYKHVQLRVLNAIKWTLSLRSAMDILDKYETPNRPTLDFILCICYSEPDMLCYTSSCIAISVMAMYDPSLLTAKEINCFETIHRKMIPFY